MDQFKIALIQPLLTSLGIVFVFWIFRQQKSLRLVPKVNESDITPEHLAKYRRYGMMEGFSFIGIVALATYLLKFPLGKVFDYLVSTPEHEMLISLPKEVVLIVGMILSAAVLMRFSTNLMTFFYKKEDIAIYQYLGCKQVGFDSYKLMRPFAIWGTIIGILFFAKCIQTTSYLTNDSIIVNRFLSLISKKYPITDLTEIVIAHKQKAPNGNIIARPEYIMKFKDGFIWELDQNDNPQTTAFVHALATKASIAPKEVEIFDP